MISDPPDFSHLDALFAALRDTGRQLEDGRRWLTSAERATAPGFRLQTLAVAGRALAAARACLDDADARLARLGALPAPLDQLPARIDAARADLCAADARLLRVAAEAAVAPVGRA